MEAGQWDLMVAGQDDLVSLFQSAYVGTIWEKGLAWLVWEFYGWAYFAKNGADLLGWSLRQKSGEWLLCVRVLLDGQQLVGFMSDTTTTGCVQRMLNRLESGDMTFYPDKYA